MLNRPNVSFMSRTILDAVAETIASTARPLLMCPLFACQAATLWALCRRRSAGVIRCQLAPVTLPLRLAKDHLRPVTSHL